MAFPPDYKSPGRPPGALCKRTKEFIEVLEQNNFCTASALLDVYKIAMTRFTEDIAKEDAGRYSPMESNAHKYLGHALSALSEIASRSYPKLKSVEQRKANPTDGMTLEQKLEAAKVMVLLLEREASGSKPTG
jgi:hypothetical protein